LSAADAPTAGSLTGRTLGEFVVDRKLGEGGFGDVYLANQPVLGRDAVVKTLRWNASAGGTVVQRFLREARIASSLDHPFAAHIYAFGAETDGTLWIAMERVHGTTLGDMIEATGPMPLSRLVPLVERVCEVLHSAHERGIVHRDIKPDNIMVISRAGRLSPKLLDFGIAKALAAGPDIEPGSLGRGTDPTTTATLGAMLGRAGIDTTGDEIRTGRGITIGTPAYMAPEQWIDPARADQRADLYSLGAVFYEALTGQRAFKGDSVKAVAIAHARQPPPKVPAGLPPALDRVIARALAKRADDRYATALELAADLRAASGEAGGEAGALPAIGETLRDAVLAAAPQPIADAVAAYEAATTPERGAKAVAAIAATVVRYLGVLGVAARSASGGMPRGARVDALLAAWRERGLSIAEWLELAAATCDGVVPDLAPVPELALLFARERPHPSAVADLATAPLDDPAALAASIGLVERVLAELRFLSDYALVADLDGNARSFMGARRRRRPIARLAVGATLERGEPALLDAAGAPIVRLHPFVQIAPPSPGADDELFLLERGHRLGAVLVAHPVGYERRDDRAWAVFGGAATDGDGAAAPAERAPYRGLSSFSTDDADWFFGRERDAEAFANRLREQAFIAVVGPSGVGKSSFVKAGVLPRLPASHLLVMRPGDRPLAALAAALAVPLGREVDAAALAAPEALRAIATELATTTERQVVLVVDQFEELVTLCRDAAERERFGALLVAAGDSTERPVRVIVTLRDDFLLRLEQIPTLRDRLGRGLQLLTTPAAADLLRVLVEPAKKAGYTFDDPDLPARIVADVEARPGALALLSFTALRLWELRDQRYQHLKRASYELMGGVGGALARHAEETLATLPEADRPLVREAFRHLVTADGTRAVLSKAELAEVLGKGDRADAVIQALIGARLLASSEGVDGEDRIEVVHEALLSGWPRLVEWRRDDAENARLRDQLRAAARQWDDRGRDKGLLWRGEALMEYSLWRARYQGKLTEREEAFAAASVADAARGRRIRRALVATAVAVLSIASVVLLLMYRSSQEQRRGAERARGEARVSADEARQRVVDLLFEQGRAAAVGGRPLEALVYLDAANQRGAHGAALEYLVGQAVRTMALSEQTITAHRSRVGILGFSDDGTLLATGGGMYDRTVKTWDVATGAMKAELADLEGGTAWIGFRAKTHELVVVTALNRVVVWNGDTDSTLYDLTVDGSFDPFGFAALTPDGARLVVVSYAADAALRDGRTGGLLRSLPTGPASTAQVSAGGERLAVGTLRGEVIVYALPAGTEVSRVTLSPNIPIAWIAVAPGGHRVVAGTAEEHPVIGVWDDGRRVATMTGHRRPLQGLTISDDGRQLLSASDDATAKLWELADGRLVTSFEGHAGPVGRATFAPGGRFVATASADGTAKLWLRADGTEVATFHGHTDAIGDLAFSPDGAHLATGSIDYTARLWTVGIDGLVAERSLAPPGAVASATPLPDGSAIALGPDLAPILVAADGSTRALALPAGARPSYGRSEVIALETRRLPGASADGRVVAAPYGPDVLVWDRSNGALRGRCAGDGRLALTVRVAHDASRAYIASEDGKLRVCDLATFTTRTADAEPSLAATDVELDATGARLVAASYDKTLTIRDRDGVVQRKLTGHTNGVTAARFAPDGDRVASASLDTTVRIWDVASGEATAVLKAPVQLAAVAIDDDAVAAAATDGRIFVWETENWQLIGVRGIRDATVEWIELVDGELVAADAHGRIRTWRIDRARDLAALHDFVECRVPYALVDQQTQLRRLTPDARCDRIDARGLLGE
jgi:WD40 repeat protein